MGEDTLKNILIGFILVSLFSTLILTAIVDMGNKYNKNTTELVGTTFNYTGFNESTNNVQGTSENLREKFEKQNIFSVVAGVVVSGIFDIGKTMITMIITPFSLVANILLNVLNVPLIVINVIGGILILTLIFGLWSLIKIGN